MISLRCYALNHNYEWYQCRACKELGLKINGKPRLFSREMADDFDVIIEFDELGIGEYWDIRKPSTTEDYKEVRSEIWRRVEELVRKLLA